MFVNMARFDEACFEDEIKIVLIVTTNLSVDFRKYIAWGQISLEAAYAFFRLTLLNHKEPAQDLLAELGLTTSLSALIEVRLLIPRKTNWNFNYPCTPSSTILKLIDVPVPTLNPIHSDQ